MPTMADAVGRLYRRALPLIATGPRAGIEAAVADGSLDRALILEPHVRGMKDAELFDLLHKIQGGELRQGYVERAAVSLYASYRNMLAAIPSGREAKRPEEPQRELIGAEAAP